MVKIKCCAVAIVSVIRSSAANICSNHSGSSMHDKANVTQSVLYREETEDEKAALYYVKSVPYMHNGYGKQNKLLLTIS